MSHFVFLAIFCLSARFAPPLPPPPTSLFLPAFLSKFVEVSLHNISSPGRSDNLTIVSPFEGLLSSISEQLTMCPVKS